MGVSNVRLLRILKFAAIVFFPVVIVTGLANTYNDRLIMASNLKVLQEHELGRVTMQKHAMRNMFENIISDLEIVSLHTDLKQLLSASNAVEIKKHRQDLGEEFIAFLHHKEVYDQLRILNLHGVEIIRAEKTAASEHLVASKRLQNKAHRPYFIAAIHGEPESVYVSPISLNIERHQIERPYKPVIQLSMSLANEQGKTGGVLVLNYLAEHLFAIINEHAINNIGIAQLVDSKGFWIKAEDSKDEWGDMLDGRKNRAFRFDHAAAWETISKSEHGQFTNADGMFTFYKINPFEMHHRSGHAQASYVSTQATPSNTWVLLSYIPSDLLAKQVKNKDSMSYVNQSVLILSLLILSLLFAQKRVEHIEDLGVIKQKDMRLRAVVDTALDGIITIDHKGVISSSNPAACKMFGYEEGEMLDENIRMIVPEPDKLSHDAYIDHYIETREERAVNNTREVYGEKKDGSQFPVELCVGAKEFEDGWLFTGIVRDITERKLLAEKLEKIAISDALTGIYNRGYFTSKLEEEFMRSKRYQLSLSIMMLDLDHFKSVNDQYGHPAGDAVLIALTQQIQESIRTVDVLARYGGEEFVIIMPETDADGAQVIAERIRHDVEAMKVDVGGKLLKKTISIGIACLTDEANDESADAFLIRADDALYQAKHLGRNRVVLCQKA